jgi:hypothetical protein
MAQRSAWTGPKTIARKRLRRVIRLARQRSTSAESMNQTAYWLACCLDSLRNCAPPLLSQEIRRELDAEQGKNLRMPPHLAPVIDIMEASKESLARDRRTRSHA